MINWFLNTGKVSRRKPPNHLEWDWKENALKKAKSYAESMNMSNSAIYDQLVSEYGEKFTPEEAQYAIDHLQ